METDFTPQPHQEAIALITGKPVMVKRVFNSLLPEIKARAFTVAGIESANCLKRIRDAVASVPLGAAGGQTWDEAKLQIVDELEPYLGDGADYRSELILRVNSFQAYSASIHEAGMADDDTTHFQYLHGECEVPTPSHLALNGIILPKDDPFWETHTGPWGHLGCVCYKRPMNPDMVEDERVADEQRNPDSRLVLEGPVARQLGHGDIIRDGRHYDVNIDGPDNSGFKWSPGDFKIPLKDLEKKYDPEVWSEFQGWAQGQPIDEKRSVWDWLNSAEKSSPENHLPGIFAGTNGTPKHSANADTQGSLESSADFARGGAPAAPDHDATESERASRLEAEQARLIQWAKLNGHTGHKLPEVDTSGGEHNVFFDEATARYFKETIPAKQKGYGIALGSRVHGATPSEYLDRLALQNQIFDDDIRLERIVPNAGKPIIVISQTAIEGVDAPQPAINALMQAKGFEKLIDGAYYDERRGLLVYDLLPKNAKQAADGIVYPIDPVVQRITPDFADFLRSDPARIHNR